MLIKWFQKKQSNEIKKLTYQNNQAAVGLQAYFKDRDPALVIVLQDFMTTSSKVQLEFCEFSKISSEQLKMILLINSNLRKLYNQTFMAHSKSFDECYIPVLGWKEYFKG